MVMGKCNKINKFLKKESRYFIHFLYLFPKDASVSTIWSLKLLGLSISHTHMHRGVGIVGLQLFVWKNM